MPDGTCAVFVAINDNHRAWYEMLIPFVLSLRATDFEGRIVVIGHGVSPAKADILARQGIALVPAAPDRGLPLGRYIEVARYCAAHPEIRKAALYDADIWFCAPHHDLFALIDRDALYACPDPLFCEFIVSPLMGPQRDALWDRVVTKVLGRHGHALQAGLVAGTAAAWASFAHHVETCAQAIGTDFRNCFGLDTTFLHLWAAENDLVLLPPTQNFITRWGVGEVSDNGVAHFAQGGTGEPIRAIHMAGNVRFYDRWRYYANHADAALADGAAFALSSGELGPPAAAGPDWDRLTQTCAAHGLRLTSLRREADARGDVSFESTPSGLAIQCTGNVAITVEIAAPAIDLNVYLSHPSGFPSPIRRGVTCHGHEARSHNDLLTHYRYHLSGGSPVTLTATSLGGQLCKSFWLLSDAPEIEQ